MRSTVVAVAALLTCCLADLRPGSSLHGQQPATAATEPRPAAPGEIATDLSRWFPAAFDRAGAGGVVEIRLHVDAAGRADSLLVASSTGFARLDDIALGALHRAKYIPAMGPDGSIAAWLELTLQFPGRNVEDRAAATNRDAVVELARSRHPAELKRRRIRVEVPLQLTVDGTGSVTSLHSPDADCFPSATKVARDVARQLLFEPAADGARRREIAATLTFDDSVTLLLRGDAEPLSAARTGPTMSDSVGPDRRPELNNQLAVQRSLVRNYPAKLRDQGRGGSPTIRVRIDEAGTVITRQVASHSGYCELDIAALDVARTMRFSPALSDGKPKAVWIEIPIVFTSH